MIFKTNAQPMSLSFDNGPDWIFRSYWNNGDDMSESGFSNGIHYLSIQSLNGIYKRRSDNSHYREYAY